MADGNIRYFYFGGMMFGAVVGDVVGSAYEFHNVKTKDFELFTKNSCFTDDTILTCATAEWLLTDKPAEFVLKKWGDKYKNRYYENGKIAPFGKGFLTWLETGIPYGAKSNGCVMRISPIGLMEKDLTVALEKAYYLTNLTHNHPESLKYVSMYIETMFLVKKGVGSNKIKTYLSKKYECDLSKSIDEIRPNYNKFYVSCKNSVPQAIVAGLDAVSFEDAIRNAISLGGDSDTLACMAGGIAEIRFGVPECLKIKTMPHLDSCMQKVVNDFYQKTR